MENIALLFPGQGSQYTGMGKGLYDEYPGVRQVFEEASDTLGFNLMALCFEGGMEELTKTENTQPAILTCSVAAFKAYMQEIGVEPKFLAGHSLGEISALTCAGAMKFSDAVKIVRQRGLLMQEASAFGIGAMAAVSGIDRAMIEDGCSKNSTANEVVVVSNYNSPDQTVISGHKDAVARVGESLKERGAKVVPLKVSAPFHSPLMRLAADKMAVELAQYQFEDIKWPVISNVSALPYSGSGQIIDTLVSQIVKPVRWQESMEYLQKQGVGVAVEVGPKNVLGNLMKKNVPDMKVFSYDKKEDIESLRTLQSPAKASVNIIPEFRHTVLTKCIAITVCTRNRNWDNDEYQKGVVEPYRRVQKTQEDIEKERRQPTFDEMKAALDMLRSVFNTKKVPIEEQIERFNEVFDVTSTRHLFADFKIG